MQLTAFVSPKAVPQMREAASLSKVILERWTDCHFCALVPNLRGAKDAFECGFKEVSCVISVSESHNRANVNRSRQESFQGLAEMLDKLPQIKVVPALCTVFGCPYEGPQPLDKVLEMAENLISKGFTSLELADTIGVGTPDKVEKLFSTLKKEFPHVQLLAHLHDTRNNGILNSWVALHSGADIIHTSLGGLGGCPFAPGASGNTSTEDFVWILEESGISTGVDFTKLLKVARDMKSQTPGSYSGHQVFIEKVC
jgi:hydroxymethylglutaryl-CoA lyase